MPTPYAELMSDTGILEDVDTAPPGPATKQSTGVQVMPSRRNARVQVTPIVAKLSKAKGRLIIMTLLALKMNQSVICCKYLAIQATPILCDAAIQCDLPQISVPSYRSYASTGVQCDLTPLVTSSPNLD